MATKDLRADRVGRRIAYLAGVILVGALGSATWEVGLKPLGAFIGRLVVSALSSAFRGYRNGIYADIARGPHEHAALSAMSLLTLILIMAVVMINSISFLAERARKRIERAKSMSAADLHVETEHIHRRIRWLTWANVAAGIIFIVVLQTDLYRSSYIDRAISHFEQLLAINAPYMTNAEVLLLRSQFAQIQTSDDYERVVGVLEQRAKQRKLHVPEFKRLFS